MSAMRVEGRVKWFSERGYGFLASSGARGDVFVHYKDVEGEGFKMLQEGELVTFVLEESEKGPRAVAVRRRSVRGRGL